MIDLFSLDDPQLGENRAGTEFLISTGIGLVTQSVI